MSDPRTWNRREFSVTQAGYFTVLKPTGRFSALRLPGGFRYLVSPFQRTKPEQEARERAASQATGIPLQILPAEAPGHYLVRAALIALTAAVITFALLWWISKP